MKELITRRPTAFVPCLVTASIDMGVMDDKMLLNQDNEGLFNSADRETGLARDGGDVETAGE